MKPVVLFDIAYVIILILVCLRIIFETRSSSKTLAYLLLVIFLPVGGMLFYFIFGVNYYKRIIYTKKLVQDEAQLKELNKRMIALSAKNPKKNISEIGNAQGLVSLLMNDCLSPLTTGNAVKLLINGEGKFPEVFSALENARHHIHLEYYIYDDDVIGNALKDLLIKKAQEGVEVRVIYDDYGSRSIRKKLVKELHEGGVEAYPFNKVRVLFFANRINYRNHRKIIIVDGDCGFVGGINIADRYVNNPEERGKLYWRDTHIRIDGPGIMFLQHLFLSDWNFCSGQKLKPDAQYFHAAPQNDSNMSVQIAAGGPDSSTSTIKLSFLKAINLARTEILLSTPYMVPGGSIMDALKVASLSGVTVKILVPGICDSKLVNAAAWSNYGELLRAGVEIYTYHKGFIHSKIMVVDGNISIVGTANMDHRSFDLNFEVNAIVYSSDIGDQMRKAFQSDLRHTKRLHYEEWISRPIHARLLDRTARLFSPLL